MNLLTRYLGREIYASVALVLAALLMLFAFLDFIRDIGKHITVNYMMAKDSVKKRLGSEAGEGLSFTEFSYQLVQGTDFLHHHQRHSARTGTS